ncbi:hypothetical protein MK805_14820 [Shimazuella sp. AN120528]|uniref:hypothetical protein n=1 Tax=Shimazuella soli TaxID=1892854 RepID=UPI001F0F7328|nr:hypothetical protein [Shimazuella soli]MCH5586213.1 hypothetical protein [Shimazuella soli]
MPDFDLQLAEIRLVRLKQELEQKYGHYDQLRRTATGILQAVDLSLVRSNIIKSVTEEMMVVTPKYWLAPALVALTGWVSDQRELAQRALEEAMRRNPKKTSLFFALVSRRYNRQEACRQWFAHYFQEVNPMKMDRDMVMVIDGITNGVLPLSICNSFMNQSEQWIEEFTSKVDLLTEERDKWRDALFQRVNYPSMEENYPYLVENSANWKEVEYSAQIVQYHEEIGNYMKQALNRDLSPSSRVEEAVDDLLEKLVFQYEEDELPLRREERSMQIIIEAGGEDDEIEQKIKAESELFAPTQNYLELLRNMAMYPETLNVSAASQRYALAVLKDVVVETHNDLALSIRNQVPIDIQLISPKKIRELHLMDDWTFFTQDGNNEKLCEESIREALKKSNKRKIKEMWKARFSKSYLKHKKAKLILAAVLSFGVFSYLSFLYSPIIGVLPLLAGAYFYKWRKEKPFRDQLKEIEQYVQTQMQATLADVVDYRSAFEEADQKAERLPELLKTLHVKEALQRNYDKTRVIMR